MTENDVWGCDPAVRAMRRLFARMESQQKDLLQHLGMSPYDPRLKSCREGARDLFERMLSHSAGGRGQNEDDAAALYSRCFIQALRQRGHPVRDEAIRMQDVLGGELN